MNAEVIQFECSACRMQLTVPAHMAGVSGPCPTCGQVVTSPMPAAAAPAAPMFGTPMQQQPAPGQWAPPPSPMPGMGMPPAGPFPASPPPQPPGLGQMMTGGLMGGDAGTMQPQTGGTSLPPRRGAGQPPQSGMPPGGTGAAAPGWAPPQGGLGLGLPPLDPSAAPPGMPPAGPATQSRLIPGAPSIPSMGPGAGFAGQGMAASMPMGSLMGRDMPPPPVTPSTQALNPATQGMPPLSLSGAGMMGGLPASPMPAGRNLAALRPNRGSSFIRLGIAALFLLGFLGLAGYFLKDTVSGLIGGTEAPELPETKPQTGQITPKAAAEESPPPQIAEKPASEPEVKPVEKSGLSPLPLANGQNLESKPPEHAPTEPAPKVEIAKAKPVEDAPPMKAIPAESQAGLQEVPPAGTSTPPIPGAAPGAPTPRISQSSGLDDKPSEKVPEEAKPALEALNAFLSAPSSEERARHVLAADFMKPLIDRYYSRNNDGPIVVDHISFGRYDKQPDLGSGAHCIFHIESKTWEYPVPAMLEQQADGWKVDWLTFIELKDRKLEEFLKTYQEGRARFHVGIFRQHYFGDEVPNRDQKDAFSVGLPRPNPFRSPVFLSKDDPLSRELKDRLPWEVHVWAVVELEWKKLGSQQWVELVSMPQMHWYSVPATTHPISTSEKPPLEAAPAAPAGGGAAFPPGIKRSPAGQEPTIQKATPVPDQAFPPGIRRSPATRSR